MPRVLLLSILLLTFASTAEAETRYVTDQYDFNLRAGESNRYRIIRTLISGTPLEIIDIDSKSGYAHVRTGDGKTGYILTRYLQAEPAARERLAEMSERLRQLQQAPDQLAARLGELQTELQVLDAENKVLKGGNQRLEQELAEVRYASANAVRINHERQQLQEQIAGLMEQLGELEHRNRELANLRDQRWFLIGASVAGGGLLIGLILPSLRLRRQRSKWGSL